MSFDDHFRALTSFAPMVWQRRLYGDHFFQGDIPSALDLATGLGKTSVMAIWLIARAMGKDVPRRLVYVVDRRAVVDQATTEAERLRAALENGARDLKTGLKLGERKLPISTLRGRHVDNREWLSDPASPAIVVGTVDMIGSRLLFEGYGVSRRMRPFHAGLLGTDTLIVLDEAHLVPPFEKLLETIENGTKKIFGPQAEDDRKLIRPLRLLSLSATGRKRDGEVFRLGNVDFAEKIIKQRVEARKTLSVHPFEKGSLEDKLAERAWTLTGEGASNVRVLVYCDSRQTVEKTKTAIEELAKSDKKKGVLPTEIDTELFTGARRFREREIAAGRLEELGFIAGSKRPPDKPVFLIATSAAEVGVDLDVDHMVCDLVAWERMVQRFGRVNRRGVRNDTKITVVIDKTTIQEKTERKGKDGEEVRKKKQRLKAVTTLLSKLSQNDGVHNASPAALGALKEGHNELIEKATTPAPLRPALTRALVDAWSMTSLEKHTGRPEIAPWLRGWVDDAPQTEIVWRAFLPWRDGETKPDKAEVKEFFAAAPPHVTEILETYTNAVRDTLIARAGAVLKNTDKSQDESASRDHSLTKNSPAAIILSRAGDVEKTFTIGELTSINREELLALLAGRRVIVEQRIGGLNKDGLLDKKAKERPVAIDADWNSESGLYENHLQDIIGFRVRRVNAGEEATGEHGWKRQYSFPLGTEDDDKGAIIIEGWCGPGAQLRSNLAVAGKAQSLAEHHDWTGEAAREITEKLCLPVEYRDMLAAAARLHDEGKKRDLWQDAMGAGRDGRPYAKTMGGGNGKRLLGYRHEFGSLRDAEQSGEIAALPEELRDLALHLIAAHHGHARPVIAAIDPDLPPSSPQLQKRALDAALRFARLQRRWGPWGLAWWETLLRAADWAASRRHDAEEGTSRKGTAADDLDISQPAEGT